EQRNLDRLLRLHRRLRHAFTPHRSDFLFWTRLLSIVRSHLCLPKRTAPKHRRHRQPAAAARNSAPSRSCIASTSVAISPNRGCHCEAGAAGRSNLVTPTRRLPEASESALPALRDCFVALRAPRNDSRGFALRSPNPAQLIRSRI